MELERKAIKEDSVAAEVKGAEAAKDHESHEHRPIGIARSDRKA